ncbi:hypothetical protein CHS0354_026031 [Potamilus streckersoni]|uniref:Concentrative nucleoside transporter N-terminal domain-containing protein n=1 Tax=Potamilus streckersoni TaxID=2493646 RepID=A0AAE0SB11_9BIVA|nr:hypothetical protein CHS0354_026031 [Potamilus streckersoni]
MTTTYNQFTIFDRNKINWHTVFWGISLQYLFALFIMKTSVGIASMHWCSDRLEEFIKYSDKGAAYVFGDNLDVHRFAFKTMPSLLLFAAVVSVLIYLEVIGFIVQTIGGFLSFCLNTSAPESINVASNIFLSGVS